MVAALRGPTRAQRTKLAELLGSSAAWRLNQHAPRSDDERAAQRAAYRVAQESTDALRAALEARRDAVLKGDAEYQRLMGEWRAARDAKEAMPQGFLYPIEVGCVERFAGFVSMRTKADGYSWAEVLGKLTDHKSK